MDFNKACVLGLGYIGLPTASLLANNGFQVIGVEVKSSLIEIINNGDVHIEEPGLKTLVQAAINSGQLKAKLEPEEADVFFIAVPTPVKKEIGEVVVDLSYVEKAAEMITPYLRQGNLVVLESTSPPGTTEDVVLPILEKSGLKVGTDLFLAHCPERVLPGSTMRELIHNDRVIGGINKESAEAAGLLYKKFIEGSISLTDAKTAEMTKLVENLYRDVNIALANELGAICEKAGINVWETIKLANLHPRVNVHLPGPGVGGHCISVDPWFVISAFKDESNIIKLGREINDRQPEVVVRLVKGMLKDVSEPVVTILGVSYKGNIDDTRESPVYKVIEHLKEAGVRIKVYDPHVSKFEYDTCSLKEAFTGSDCALLITDHDEFKFLYPKELAGLMRTRQVLDTRNCLDQELWETSGFKYQLLGVGES